jgi:hypothetical protein|eukprot:TRINITY_DN96330_c0_g1_i1.p1 TRINITY_DN96330_c0_g1~~TRINITY_DN96330_c0_g1_i1.p1  ORF type:complete len:269 (+),score=26.39 TRINITY_DN96330_c0_g1_i1:10-816(+)
MQALWNNPIFYKYRLLEKREYRRSKSSFWIRQMSLVWCVLVPLGFVAMLALPEILDSISPKFDQARLYLALTTLASKWIGALSLSHFLVLMVAIGLSLQGTSSLVTAEREKKTLESLQSTMMSPTEIVNGRLASGLYPVLRELLIVSPLALCLGAVAGFGLKTLLCIALLFSTVAFYGMVGLWCSYLCKNTQHANRMASGVAGSLLILVPLAAKLSGEDSLMMLHPVYASYWLSDGVMPVILVTAFHFCAASLLWLDALRRERSAVRV